MRSAEPKEPMLPWAAGARSDLWVFVDHQPRGKDQLGMSLSQEPGRSLVEAN